MSLDNFFDEMEKLFEDPKTVYVQGMKVPLKALNVILAEEYTPLIKKYYGNKVEMIRSSFRPGKVIIKKKQELF
jgi:hypothetical protein